MKTLECQRLCDSLQVAHSHKQKPGLWTPILSFNIYMSDTNASDPQL